MLVCYFFSFSITTSFCQVDPSFSPVITGLPVVTSTAPMGDGKVVVTGEITRAGGIRVGNVVKLNSNGTLDNTFSIMLPAEPTSGLFCAVDINGKILVGGRSEYSHFFLLRFNADGSRDESFSSPEEISFTKIVPLPDGKYLGLHQNAPGIVRLNIDGSLDETFNPGEGFGGGVSGDVAIQSDGKAIVVGEFLDYDGTAVKKVVRINTDGTCDNTFQVGTGMSPIWSQINSVAIIGDKVFLAGSFLTFNTKPAKYIVKLNADGSVDNNFIYPNAAANLINDGILAVRAYQGKLILGGTHNQTEYRLMIINADGTPDSSFPVTVLEPSGPFVGNTRLHINSNGTDLFINGSFNRSGTTLLPGLLKIDGNGNINQGFEPSLGGMATVKIVKRLSNGSLIIGGVFNSVNDVTANNLALLNADGSIDTDFANNLGLGFDKEVNTVVVQGDGKIVVGGRFRKFNGFDKNLLVRLNADGTIDNTFVAPITAGSTVEVMQTLPGNELLVGGELEFTEGATTIYNFSKLTTTGQLANSFTAQPLGINDFVYGLGIQSDGHVVIAGVSTSPERTGFLRKLTSEGALVNEYNFLTAAPTMLKILQDDSILVPTRSMEDGGLFPIYQFSKDGGLVDDNSLRVDDGYVFSIEELPGDNLLVAGMFAIGDQRLQALVKVKRDGSIEPNVDFDLHFVTYESISEGIRSLVRDDSDGQWYVAGAFNRFGQQQVFNMVKVDIETLATPTDLSFTTTFETGTINLSWTDNAGAEHGYSVFRSEGAGFVSIDSVGESVTTFSDRTALSQKEYIYKVVAFGDQRESPVSNAVLVSTASWLPPLTPGSVTGSIINGYQAVALAWLNVENENGFEIERSVNNAAFVKLTTVAQNELLYQTDFSFETSVRYRVRAVNHFGGSAYSAIVAVPNVLAPPLDLSATENFVLGTITLSWFDNSSRESGFAIFRSEDGGSFVAIDSANANTNLFIDDTAVPQKTYSYKIVAFDDAETSPGTNVVLVSTSSWHLPLPPETFSYYALQPDFKTVRIAWSDVGDATGYELERSVNGDAFSKIAEPGRNESYDDGLPAGVVRYRIRSVNAHGKSGYSRIIEVVLAPTNLAITKDNVNGVLHLAWADHDATENGFIIFRSQGSGVFTAIDSVAANVIFYGDETALPVREYFYKIAAYRTTAQSDGSNTVYVSTSNWLPPSEPKNFNFAFPDHFLTVSLSWTDVDDETSFDLERSINGAAFARLSLIEKNVFSYSDDFMFETSVRYRLRAANKFGYSPYSSIAEIPVILGTEDSHDPVVTIHPNPASQKIFVAAADSFHGARGTLHSAEGKIVRTFILENGGSEIDLSGLANGVYYVKLQGEKLSVSKILKR